jgi:diguanylate cyclase (GGDEF)-like protein
MLDPLTNIPNRRAFLDAAMRRMRQRSRNPEPVTALLFDLDHFKSVNDRFGHHVGDEVLRIFTAKAAAEFRSTDIMGRLGGEEFGAVLFGAGEGTAVATAERIRRALMVATAEIEGKPVDATVSVGVAALGTDSNEDIAELLSNADAALYLAKERGRNRVEVYGKPSPPLAPALDEAKAAVAAIAALRMVGPAATPLIPAANEDDVIEWAEPQQLRAANQ